ncbi:MAG: DUF3857 domain-containing protein [Candidatus Riflebacteria bacterium]|nr:DUF3857 domain-containing protein [Candidatus Riflebacteria bacterium]
MKKFLLILSFILAVNTLSADVLILNKGEEHVGNLVEIEGNNISFQELNEKTAKTFDTSDVAHILISKIRTGDEISSIASITEPIALNVLKNLPNPNDFADSDYITLYRHLSYEIISETEMVLRSREIVQIFKEPGLDCANQSFYYNTDNTECQIEFAHTYTPSGKVYHLTDDALSDESLNNTTPEYAKLKKLKMAMKNVDLGSVIDYSVIKRIKNVGPLNPKSFRNTFGEREPVLHEEYTFSFPSNLKYNKLQLQWENNTPKFTDKSTKDKTVWNWEFVDPKGYVREQNMLPANRIFPRVVIYNEYDKNKTAELLALAYKDAEPDSKLLDEYFAKAEISDSDTDYEKVCKIYNFLNKEIAIIGMGPDDMGSFKPVSANTTITKKYANEQAFLGLMHKMLDRIGIRSYIGFTEGKREKLTFKDYPNLNFATTPILKVIIDNMSYYTDGGSIYTPFSVISTSIQGSNATFLDEEKKEFFNEVLPLQTLDWNTYSKTIFVKIQNDGSMDVTESTLYKGPYEESIRELKSIKEKEKSNYAEKRVKSVHPNAELISYGFTDMADLSAPAVYNISYKIPNAAQKASENIMTFTNFWVNYSSGSASLAKRKYPMKYWATEHTLKTIIFELPEGFNWVKWDKQYKHKSPSISFSSNLSQNNRQLIYSDEFEANVDEFLDDKAYQNYRQCILTMSELANQWIIIEK